MASTSTSNLNAKNFVTSLPVEVLRYHLFSFLTLPDLTRLDTTSSQRRARCIVLKILNGFIIRSKVQIISLNCAEWTIRRGIRLFDVAIGCHCNSRQLLFRDISLRLFKYNCDIQKVDNMTKEGYTNEVILLVSQNLPNLASITHTGIDERVNTYLTDESVIMLASRCPRLIEVDLGQCSGLSKRAVIALSQGCPQLMSIYLNFWNCDDDALMELSRNCPNLRNVNLGDCMITDGAICELSRCCRNLMRINLS